MAYAPDPAKLAIAFQGGQLVDEGKPVRFTVVDLGPVVVTSGALAACDPLVDPVPRAFERRVPPGRYPVLLAVAALENGDERVAFGQVKLADAPVARWEPAVQPAPGEPLGDDDYLGYGVDSGTGAFMDAVAGRLLEARMTEQADYSETIIAEMERTYRPTWDWASVRPAPDREENVVCFSSGWGDGVYPSFFGLAEDGRPVALLTDFLVLADDLPKDSTDVGPVRAEPPPHAAPAPARAATRPWWRFWRRA